MVIPMEVLQNLAKVFTQEQVHLLGGGICVADYVIVGANSVLTKDITESGVIVAGVPAKVIRKMTPEELERRMNKH